MKYHSNLVPAEIREVVPKNKAVLIYNHASQKRLYLFLKRSFDVIFSVLFIVSILSWLVPLMSILILFDSPGPIFFVQRRTGRNDRSFWCLKFRTMVVNEDADEKQA